MEKKDVEWLTPAMIQVIHDEYAVYIISAIVTLLGTFIAWMLKQVYKKRMWVFCRISKRIKNFWHRNLDKLAAVLWERFGDQAVREMLMHEIEMMDQDIQRNSRKLSNFMIESQATSNEIYQKLDGINQNISVMFGQVMEKLDRSTIVPEVKIERRKGGTYTVPYEDNDILDENKD